MAKREDSGVTASTITPGLVDASMVQDWQVLAVAVTVLIAVLTLYGTLIKRNYDTPYARRYYVTRA